LNVRQLIALLEKIEDKETLVYARNAENTCCNGGNQWEELTEVNPAMITEMVWVGPEGGKGPIRRIPKSINVIKLDVY
jgi:hypothetical protein